MSKVNKICIFRDVIYQSGGIETWLYNIAAIYGKTHDITIYYDTADKLQLLRLARLVRCIKYEGQDIECDTGIWCYDFLGKDTTKAKKTIHIVHADYSYNYKFNFNVPYTKDIDEIYAVSERAAKSASRIFNRPVGVLYNPIFTVLKKEPIKIVSGTRLTWEKGLPRMKRLAKALDKANVNYTWEIYTPSYKTVESFSENVILKKPVMSILKKIKDADFMVQLSDTESFGYSIVETMALGTKLVVTNIHVLKELGINKYNAIIVPLKKRNYKNIVKQIVAQSKYAPPTSDYNKILGKPSRVDYNPSIVKNISKADILLDGERWLEPGQVAVIEDYNNDNRCLKIIK